MFSALCRRLLPLALGTGFVFAAAPAFSALGDTASSQARHIATVFPGRRRKCSQLTICASSSP